MATLFLKLPKHEEAYQQFLKDTGIDHLYNKADQPTYNSEKVITRSFIKKNDALRSDNGCITVVVACLGDFSLDDYYVILANNAIDKATLMLMYQKSQQYWVNKTDLDKYNERKPLLLNDLWERQSD